MLFNIPRSRRVFVFLVAIFAVAGVAAILFGVTRAEFDPWTTFAAVIGTGSITVSGMVLFIDNYNNATAGIVAGCGRRSNPFSSLPSFADLNTGAGNNPAAADNIFIYPRNLLYTGGITLLNNQRLIGQSSTSSLS